MANKLKQLVTSTVGEALVYLYSDVGPMSDNRLFNECAELELVASEKKIVKTRESLVEVGVLEFKGRSTADGDLYGLTKKWIGGKVN